MTTDSNAALSVASPARGPAFMLPPAVSWGMIAAGLVLALLGTSLGDMRIAAIGAATAGGTLVLAYPSAALVLLFVLSFGMLPAVLLPDAAHDKMRNLVEVGLLGMAALLALRAWLDPRIRIQYLVLSWMPFLVVWGCLWMLAFIQGYFVAQYELAIPDARKHFGWAMIVVAAFVEGQHRWRLHAIVMAIASILSAEMLLQAISGEYFLSQIHDVQAQAAEGSTVPRGYAWGGEYLMMYVVYYCAQKLVASRDAGRIPLFLPLLLVNVAGLLCTFTRGVWFGALAGLVGLVVFGGALRMRLALRLGTVAAVAAFLVIGLANSGNEFAEAVVSRALSVEQEGSEESSMGARYHENREAIEPIMENFVLGLGHGGEYKKRLDPDPKFIEQAIYIHNGYLYIQLKYGIFGSLALLLLLGTVARVSRTVQRLTPPEDPWFWRSQAAMACVIAFCVNAITSPVWVEFGPTTGLACALVHLAAARAHAYRLHGRGRRRRSRRESAGEAVATPAGDQQRLPGDVPA